MDKFSFQNIISIKGSKLKHEYSFSLADEFLSKKYSKTSLIDFVEQGLFDYFNIDDTFIANTINNVVCFRGNSPTTNKLPIRLKDANDEKLLFNLRYQDKRIKLSYESFSYAQQKQSNLSVYRTIQLVDFILRFELLPGLIVWEIINDNELDGIVFFVLYNLRVINPARSIEDGINSNLLSYQSLPQEDIGIDLAIKCCAFSGIIWWDKINSKELNIREQIDLTIKNNAFFKSETFEELNADLSRKDKNIQMLYFLDDNGELSWDIYLVAKLLDSFDKIKIIVVLSRIPVFNNCSLETLKTILNKPMFNWLQTSDRFQVHVETCYKPAVDIKDCSSRLKSTINRSNILFFKGASLFEVNQNNQLDSYYLFVVHSNNSKMFTGQNTHTGIFVKLPKKCFGYRMYDYDLTDYYIGE